MTAAGVAGGWGFCGSCVSGAACGGRALSEITSSILFSALLSSGPPFCPCAVPDFVPIASGQLRDSLGFARCFAFFRCSVALVLAE